MKSFFIDTNVILDWLIPTNSSHIEATKLMELFFNDEAKGFVSSHSLTDIFYVLRKYFDSDDRRQFLLLLVTQFNIIPETYEDFYSVLNDNGFFDLEDGLQMKCAVKEDVDYIITENLKDFKAADVTAINIDEALQIVY
ncbi:MAG: PIN domain-containing protein [Spirochaetales bacterium]|nr:PIN domain-containing protein [Spirochaetales bacterium]